jgi:hypothetical protein
MGNGRMVFPRPCVVYPKDFFAAVRTRKSAVCTYKPKNSLEDRDMRRAQSFDNNAAIEDDSVELNV